MKFAELYKIRRHRTPWVLGGLLTAAVVIRPVCMYFLNTADPSTYTLTLTDIFRLALAMVAAVFGGWHQLMLAEGA
jgi:hypothetical protein